MQMIRNVEDFTNPKIYDEMIRNGEEPQSREELEAIIDEYNSNASIFKRKGRDMLLFAYEKNWKWAQKRYEKELQRNNSNLKTSPRIKTSPKFCGNCGTPLDLKVKFCPKCGMQIKR